VRSNCPIKINRAPNPGAVFSWHHVPAGDATDPWRYGGVLFWSPTMADSRYNRRPQIEALEEIYRTRKATREAAINL
jgi:hypothetical protein